MAWRVFALSLIISVFAAGLIWALPAAGIGLTLGFCLMAQGLTFGSFARWLLRLDPDRGTGLVVVRSWLLVLVAGCALVAYLSATRDLGLGYEFIPAIVPFLFLTFEVPSVVAARKSRQPAAKEV